MKEDGCSLSLLTGYVIIVNRKISSFCADFDSLRISLLNCTTLANKSEILSNQQRIPILTSLKVH